MSTNNETLKNNIKGKDYEIDTLTNERLIADHDYDGIRELDNDLPPWWKWLFYISVAFGIVYMIRMYVFDADDLFQEREFEKEMAEAASIMPVQQAVEFEIKLMTDAASLAAGKETYDKICQVCHLLDGGGLVGPNFTDDYWIHGNTVEKWFEVVETGVLEKGMIPYKDQLSPTQRLEVISYIATLHGTTPANPKAAEGEKMEWIY